MTQIVASQRQTSTGYNPAITLVRMFVITLIAIGHISTMPYGPNTQEVLFQFGYDPSWLGVNTLFIMAGFFAMRSLHSHDSPLKLLTSKLQRNFPSLIIYVAAIIFIVFPIFGIKSNINSSLTHHLSIYAFDVLTCIDPGRKLPGLLDGAKYECVIQGAIWTFRWGAIAYICSAIGWKLGALKSMLCVHGLALTVLAIYTALHFSIVRYGLDVPAAVTTGLRLGSAFLAGMSLFTLKERFSKSWGVPLSLAGLATVHYTVLPWSPFIEVLATAFWGYTAFILMSYDGRSFPSKLKNMPDLSLGLYIFHWPVAQILLLMTPSANAGLLICLTLPFTFAVSYVLWGFTRKPSQLGQTEPRHV